MKVVIQGAPDTVMPEASQAGALLLFEIISIASDVGLLWLRIASWHQALVTENESRRRSEAALTQARDAAEQAVLARSRFLASMSHEIRTPMNAIIGLARLLSRSRLEERQRLHVDRISKAGDTLLLLIDSVIDIARLETGNLHIAEKDFNLDTQLDRVAALFATEAEARGLAFDVRSAEGVPSWLRGDPARLSQILINMVGNAVKFTAVGRVDLTVSVVERREGTVSLRFDVRDTGPGVAVEQRAAIFEPFRQADDDVHRQHGGAGLGLAISSQLAALMGGEIQVDSVVGAGSTFSLFLPCRPAENEARAPAASVIRLEGARILVADDDETNREVAREILEQAGAVVETANNGLEAVALACAADARFDAVVMDVRMPGLDGLGATARLRERYDARTLPVVALTAHALEEERGRCLAAGMNGFVTKPVEPDQLLFALSRWIAPAEFADPSAPVLGPVPEPAAVLPDMLPDMIPGFDLAGTLNRFCGNAAVVRALLGGFASRCATTAEALDQLQAGAATEEARDRAHSLKGAAATLGARRVAEGAARLESALSEGDAEAIRTKAGRLAAALRETVQTIEGAGFSRPKKG